MEYILHAGRIEINVGVQGWSLYELPGFTAVAEELSSVLAYLLNKGEPRNIVHAHMLYLMHRYTLWGANGDEPRAKLDSLLERAYK